MGSPPVKKSGTAVPTRTRSSIPKMLDNTVTSTYEDVVSIVDAKIELVKLDLTKKISVVAAIVILALVLLIAIAYLITTVALLLGEITGHLFIGYLLVSLIFLGCFVFFAKFRPELLQNLIQKTLLSAHDYKQ
ncbi:MAG: DUF2207 domain-containing protein [Chlorobiaceae bacterium]|jgi:hypothetical protein|nr:DUF2207 domain-containing protein [Chlorobiaceae bacterium]NTW62680.1 DUF2207 domain-containing protein [Chlorobiaceae bacterium]